MQSEAPKSLPGEQWPGSLEEQHRLLMACVTDYAIFLLDPEGRVAAWNAGAARLFGYDEAEILGQHFARFFTPEDVARGEPEKELAAARTQGRFADDRWHIRKDGSRLWGSGVILALRDEAGQLRGFAKVTRDRTEQRRTEDALRASEERFRSLGACSPVGIFLTTTDGRCIYTNPRCQAICGFTLEESLGDGWARFVHPEDRPRVVEEWSAATLQGREYSGEFRFLSREGGTRWVHVRSAPMLSQKGELLGHVGTVEDMTGQKQLEEQLRQRAERLAEADRRKDEWIAMLAHELRGPLGPIRTAVEILSLTGPDTPELQRVREVIARQTRHLAQIVDDLLDMTRIASGKIQLRTDRLDLARLVRTTAEDYRPALERAGLRLTVEVPQTPVWVTGDATRLTQVLSNLLDNAGKFTAAGGEVAVRLTTGQEPGQAVLSVRDTGIGIESEVLARLFEPFSQADRGLHRTPGGLGLGLALVKGLTELHGGEVRAHSEGPGRGAEFVVTLPLEGEPAALSEVPSGVRPAGRRLRILVVEDNRDAADSLRVLLELLGHEVRVAYSGPDGVRTAQEWQPSVVLSDIGLPGLDGFEVAQRLRRDPATAGARLIAITGYGSEEDRRRAEEAGYNHVLKKPADPAMLLELLDAKP
jgi:PAS domain S-box-containing protein